MFFIEFYRNLVKIRRNFFFGKGPPFTFFSEFNKIVIRRSARSYHVVYDVVAVRGRPCGTLNAKYIVWAPLPLWDVVRYGVRLYGQGVNCVVSSQPKHGRCGAPRRARCVIIIRLREYRIARAVLLRLYITMVA